MYSADVKDLDMERLKKQAIMPKPKGYKLLIAMPSLEDKTDGGIFLPDSMKQQESTASVVGLVLMMGNVALKTRTSSQAALIAKRVIGLCFVLTLAHVLKSRIKSSVLSTMIP